MITSKDIKALRKALGWSQQRLADELNASQRTILRWERGYNTPIQIFQDKLRELHKKVKTNLSTEI